MRCRARTRWAAPANAACTSPAVRSQRRSVSGASWGSTYRGQWLVLDLDQLRGVDRLRAGLGDDGCHGLAGVADLLGGQDRMWRVGQLDALGHLHRKRSRPPGQLGGGEHAHETGSARRHSDAEDARPGMVAAHERHVGGSGRIEIVQVPAAAAHQRQVLPPAQRSPDHRAVRAARPSSPPPAGGSDTGCCCTRASRARTARTSRSASRARPARSAPKARSGQARR